MLIHNALKIEKYETIIA